MCGSADDLGHGYPIKSLVHDHCALSGIDFKGLLLYYVYLFVVELNHVVHDKVKAGVEYLHGTD